MVCKAWWERVPSPTLVPALSNSHYIYICVTRTVWTCTNLLLLSCQGYDHATHETQRCWRSSCSLLSTTIIAFDIISSSQDCSYPRSSVGNESEVLTAVRKTMGPLPIPEVHMYITSLSGGSRTIAF